MTQTDGQSQIFLVAIRAPSLDSIQQLFLGYNFDFGCRPHVRATNNELYETHAYLNNDQLQELQTAGYDFVVLSEGVTPENTSDTTISQENRFAPGSRPPEGLGTNPENDIGKIMSVDELGDAIARLAEKYPNNSQAIPLPNSTAEGQGFQLIAIGGDGNFNPDDYHILFLAGVHARERGGPDSAIYFVADILEAYSNGVGLTYGGKSFSASDVKTVLQQGIVVFPCVNPDGIRYDQKTNALWRKNRNPLSATPGIDDTVGVDINRNYDFLWDFKTAFANPVWAKPFPSVASDNPAIETFHGTSAFSEPETRNVRWCVETFRNIRWFMDIHSFAGDILHNWGDDQNQTTDPGMNFLNSTYNGDRGLINNPNPDYLEFIDEKELSTIALVAREVAGAMDAVSGHQYLPEQAFGLYPTSGASDDYMFSRHFEDGSLSKIYGYTMEFGFNGFYPILPEFRNNVLEVCAGMVEFCLISSNF